MKHECVRYSYAHKHKYRFKSSSQLFQKFTYLLMSIL